MKKEYEIVIRDSLTNDMEGNRVSGFSFLARLNTGRGCFLPVINGFYIAVDGIVYGADRQRVEVNGKQPRTMEELRKEIWEHWDPWTVARIHIAQPGGLQPGLHRLVYRPDLLEGFFKAPDRWLQSPPPVDESVTEDELELFTFNCRIGSREESNR